MSVFFYLSSYLFVIICLVLSVVSVFYHNTRRFSSCFRSIESNHSAYLLYLSLPLSSLSASKVYPTRCLCLCLSLFFTPAFDSHPSGCFLRHFELFLSLAETLQEIIYMILPPWRNLRLVTATVLFLVLFSPLHVDSTAVVNGISASSANNSATSDGAVSVLVGQGSQIRVYGTHLQNATVIGWSSIPGSCVDTVESVRIQNIPCFILEFYSI